MLAVQKHRRDRVQVLHVEQRVGVEHDEIGLLAFLNAAHRRFALEELRRVERRHLQDLERLEPDGRQFAEFLVDAEARNDER